MGIINTKIGGKQYDKVVQLGFGDVRIINLESFTPKLTAVGFKNTYPVPIGSYKLSEEEINNRDFDSVMIFHKVESIDVLITALNQAKERLKNITDGKQ